MITGYLLALLGALASGSGSALEAAGIRRAGAGAAMPALCREPRYLTGLASDLLGFVCAATALQFLPLFLVQSTMALSVAVTAVIGAVLGSRLPTAGWVAIVTGAVGLLITGAAASPGPADPVPVGWRLALVLVVVPVLAVAAVATRLPVVARAPALALAAAVSFGVVSIAARSLDVPDPWWRLVTEPAVWAIAVNGVTGVVVFARALQQGSAVTVSAILFTTTTVVPSLVGLIWLGDRLRPGGAPWVAVGMLLAIGSAIVTARAAAAPPAPATTPTAGPHRRGLLFRG